MSAFTQKEAPQNLAEVRQAMTDLRVLESAAEQDEFCCAGAGKCAAFLKKSTCLSKALEAVIVNKTGDPDASVVLELKEEVASWQSEADRIWTWAGRNGLPAPQQNKRRKIQKQDSGASNKS